MSVPGLPLVRPGEAATMELRVAVALVATLMVPPALVRFRLLPVRVTEPSSNDMVEAVCVPLTVTVKAFVASAPAEKPATAPSCQAPVAFVPNELVLQKLS